MLPIRELDFHSVCEVLHFQAINSQRTNRQGIGIEGFGKQRRIEASKSASKAFIKYSRCIDNHFLSPEMTMNWAFRAAASSLHPLQQHFHFPFAKSETACPICRPLTAINDECNHADYNLTLSTDCPGITFKRDQCCQLGLLRTRVHSYNIHGGIQGWISS